MILPDVALQSYKPDTMDALAPQAVHAEMAILGTILLYNEAHPEAAGVIGADDFSLDSHRRIFLRMTELFEAGSAVDLVTLGNELKRQKELESIGGMAYLCSLTEGLPRRPSVKDYLGIVKEKSELRRLIGICQGAINAALDDSEDARSIGRRMIQQMKEAFGGKKHGDGKSVPISGKATAA